MNFYNQRHKVKGLTNPQFSTQEEVQEGEDQEVTFSRDQPQVQKNDIYINKFLTQEKRRLLKETRIKKIKTKNINIKTALIMVNS